ncbi:MAG TPA: hydrogen peroxide-inducible genes activator [Sphingobacteriaceae bacterium]|nr:hydrogen peroxide-inducible genes activator [Sphingobacteriaceae bacterium]
MTLLQLEYIIAVDTYKSFILAAEKSFITQPTLSMQIQKLEASLNIKIFDRSKQPIVPTKIGKQVIEQARIILAESKKIHEIISNTKENIEGELRIGVIPTVAPYLLPKVLGAFMKKYPKLHLQIWEFTTNKIISQLKNGLLDCGILATPVNEETLIEYPLYYESFVAYLNNGSPLESKKTVTANDLLSENLWLLNEGHCMRNQVLNLCQRRNIINPERSLEYNTGSIETLKRMVDMNGGVTILPQLSILEFSEDELEKVRYFKAPEPSREISLLTNKHFLKEKVVNILKKEIIESIPTHLRDKKKKDLLQIE